MSESSDIQSHNLEQSVLASEKIQQLISQSFTLVEATINNPEIAQKDRASIALKFLEISKFYSNSQTSLANNVETYQSPVPEVKSTLLPAQYWQIDNFLKAEEYEKIWNIAIQNQEKFFQSEILNHEAEYRYSSVLLPNFYPEFAEMMRFKILQIRPTVLEKLGLPSFLVAQFEMQMTANPDGGYYKIHQDASGGDTSNRTLTYIYYFHREPKPFYGGELRIYDTLLTENNAIIQENFQRIEPKSNSIIFFDSRCKHEVLPVYSPSKKFEDCRFTLNGWIHR